MKITADTNVFLAVALKEPERKQIIELTTGHELIAPAILPFEVGNALSAMAKRGIVTAEEAAMAWSTVQSIAVDLRQINMESSLALAIRFGIYAYDAYFLECALRSSSPLLSLDKGMKHIAQRLHIEIVEIRL